MIWLIFALVAGSVPVRAVQTQEVEIGIAGTYDGLVTISRDFQGRMIFRDNANQAPISLGDLRYSGKDHGLLQGLNDDDHAQYLNAARHSSTHNATYNGALATPADVDGNATLGSHVQDGAIHLKRGGAENVSGNWLFSGVPEFLAGLRLSHGGATGNASILFEDGAQDAEVLWNKSANQFEFNRNLWGKANLTLGADGDGQPKVIKLYGQDPGEYGTISTDAYNMWLQTFGNFELKLISGGHLQFASGPGRAVLFNAGSTHAFRDLSGANRVIIDAATGGLNVGIGSTGGLSVNNTEVVSSQRAGNFTGLSASGDLAIGAGGNKITLNGQRRLSEVNLLDNPDFTIWQRNTGQFCAAGGDAAGSLTRPTPGTLNTGADRWQVSRSRNDMSSSISLVVPPGILPTAQTCLKNEVINGAPCYQYIHQTVPREVTVGLRGKWVTFAISHYLENGTSGGNIALYKTISGAPTELTRYSFSSTANTWERLAVAAQVPSDAETILVSIQSNLSTAGPMVAYVANAALIEGKYVNPSEKVTLPGDPSVPPLPKPPAEDLCACQRYYEKGSLYFTTYTPSSSSSYHYTSINYNTPKASASTITLSNLNLGPLQSPMTGISERPAYVPNQAWPQGFRFYAGGTTSGATLFNISGDWSATCPEPI